MIGINVKTNYSLLLDVSIAAIHAAKLQVCALQLELLQDPEVHLIELQYPESH